MAAVTNVLAARPRAFPSRANPALHRAPPPRPSTGRAQVPWARRRLKGRHRDWIWMQRYMRLHEFCVPGIFQCAALAWISGHDFSDLKWVPIGRLAWPQSRATCREAGCGMRPEDLPKPSRRTLPRNWVIQTLPGGRAFRPGPPARQAPSPPQFCPSARAPRSMSLVCRPPSNPDIGIHRMARRITVVTSRLGFTLTLGNVRSLGVTAR